MANLHAVSGPQDCRLHSFMAELKLEVVHPDEPSAGHVTLVVRGYLLEKINRLLEDLKGSGSSLEISVPSDCLYIHDDSWGADIINLNEVKIALTDQRFTLQGTHPGSNRKWHSSAGWVEDLLL